MRSHLLYQSLFAGHTYPFLLIGYCVPANCGWLCWFACVGLCCCVGRVLWLAFRCRVHAPPFPALRGTLCARVPLTLCDASPQATLQLAVGAAGAIAVVASKRKQNIIWLLGLCAIVSRRLRAHSLAYMYFAARLVWGQLVCCLL